MLDPRNLPISATVARENRFLTAAILWAFWIARGADTWSDSRLLLVSTVDIALLAMLAAPHNRLGRAVGVPASAAARLSIGASLVLGLFAQGLGFAAGWITDTVLQKRVDAALLTLQPVVWIPGWCAVLISLGYVSIRRTGRVVALHLLVALSFPVYAMVTAPWTRDGDLLAAAAAMAGAVVFVAVMNLYLLMHRPKTGHCAVCRYNLTGNVSGRCPECGTPIAAGTAPAAPPGPPEVKNAG